MQADSVMSVNRFVSVTNKQANKLPEKDKVQKIEKEIQEVEEKKKKQKQKKKQKKRNLELKGSRCCNEE